MEEDNILVWLPSPMGDAILCTPALRAIRQHFESANITFLGSLTTRQILAGTKFNNAWLETEAKDCPFAIAKELKRYKFNIAILFKNSFGSALSAFLARIPVRIGYARELRGLLLTDKLFPAKLPGGKFKPVSMVDYYLAVASWLGANTENRMLELATDPERTATVKSKFPEIVDCAEPVVVLVPGGTFGPSKCWPAESFAQTADWLIENYNAKVIVSIAPHHREKKIAQKICEKSKYELISLAERPVPLGELKSLFELTDLVITNDTGPRHIAIALNRKVITLFGPNNPLWTETGYENEIKLVGTASCVPCQKPVCRKDTLICMESITTEAVCSAAKKLLEN